MEQELEEMRAQHAIEKEKRLLPHPAALLAESFSLTRALCFVFSRFSGSRRRGSCWGPGRRRSWRVP